MIDRFIIEFDKGLRTLLAKPRSNRPHPDDIHQTATSVSQTPTDINDGYLSGQEKRHAASLMRVNHFGEVCAQALYQGQALTCRNPATVQALQQAAQEETEHLAWCESRIQALGGRTSLLNPVFYASSFALGSVAGALGDKWNLGFLAETERQVGAHLAGHLNTLPANDIKSRAVVAQMQIDESAHAETAITNGAAELPNAVKTLRQVASKAMTTTCYYI
jgi:ubiquinone biosynthesis monooxygenase Coq7